MGWRVAALLGLLGLSHAQTTLKVDTSRVTSGTIDYADNGTPLQGFYAVMNASSTERRPAVIIIPAWEGIGEYVRWRAQILANMGYVGFVADIYTTAVAQPVEDMAARGKLTGMYGSQPALMRTRILAAIDQAKRLPQVDPNNIVAIGYCFGGSGVLELARSWPDPRTAGIKGVMAFHAGSLQSTGSNFSVGLPIFVSVQNGFNDPAITRQEIYDLQMELEAANATWEVTDYGATVHSFTNPLTGQVANVHGVRAAYTPSSDLRSWWALRGFLLQVFGMIEGSTDPYYGLNYDYDSSFLMRN